MEFSKNQYYTFCLSVPIEGGRNFCIFTVSLSLILYLLPRVLKLTYINAKKVTSQIFEFLTEIVLKNCQNFISDRNDFRPFLNSSYNSNARELIFCMDTAWTNTLILLYTFYSKIKHRASMGFLLKRVWHFSQLQKCPSTQLSLIFY